MKTMIQTRNIYRNIIRILCLGIISCASHQVVSDNVSDSRDVFIQATLTKTAKIRYDRTDYYLESVIQNRSNADIYRIRARVIFRNEGSPIQEYGPFVLFESTKPLKPGFAAHSSRILNVGDIPWNGDEFVINIGKIRHKPLRRSKADKAKPNRN